MPNPLIIHDLEQGTEAWLEARRGIPTASCFSKILTAKTLKLSTQSKVYALEIIAEQYEQTEGFSNEHTERGHELEPHARESYQFITGNKVDEVGIVYKNSSKTVSCSPDSLIGDDGGFEVKCPMLKTHLGYLLKNEVPTNYIMQVQGGLWVTGRKWWDFMSYHPSAKPLIIRVDRDPEIMAALDKAIPEFIMMKDKLEKELMA